MKIIAFYSFKGGVGRSLSLLNIAYQLSENKGQRVGLLDLDVEASGLGHILGVTVPDDRDLLALLDPRNRNLASIEEYVVEVRLGQKSVFLLPTVADSQRLDDLRFDVALQHFLSNELFSELQKVYKLDYLLIDTRSGLSEFATFALKVADMAVVVCRLDTQNRYGVKRILQACRAVAKPVKVIVSACPAEGQKKALQSFQKGIGAKVDSVLPYVWQLYYQESIISKTQPRHTLSKLYRALASNIHEAVNEKH